MSEVAQRTGFARNHRRIAAFGLGVVVVGLLAAALAGPASQWGLWSYQTGFVIVRWAVYGVAAGAVLSLLALIANAAVHKSQFLKRSSMALVAIAVAAVAIYVPYAASRPGNPPIHDITTDIENPPVFVDVLPLREQTKATNTAEYLREWPRGEGVIDVPALQKAAFPDIQPVVLDLPPAEAFVRAAAAVRRMNWTVVAEAPDEGRIEAFDRTAWFGFIDDVVIRVRPDGTGSRIDVRSVSRVGGGDRGLNAKRIRAYVKALTAES